MKPSLSMKLLFVIVITISAFTIACKKNKADDLSGDVAKATSLKAYPGKSRIQLTWQLPSENNIKECHVIWNNGNDSLSVPVSKDEEMVDVIINDLEEGDHTFSVKNYNKQGNASTAVTVTAHAYGSLYEDSLHNRPVYKVVYNDAEKEVNITWGDAEDGAIKTWLTYGSENEEKIIAIPAYETKITLQNYDADTDSLIIYRTSYLPTPDAIDTFYTKYDTVKVQHPSAGNYTMAELKADGPGNTYELINSVLGGNAEETPDCSHPDFGRHIGEEYNDELKENVFAFYLHVTPDNDRCKNFDRQRCEIKTYGPSPDSLKAFNGDEMIFKWKFKLDAGFQPSYSFTHIHQIKAGDGSNAGSPIITITPRYDDPEKLEIIHNGDNSSTTLGKVKRVDLDPFKGTWIQAIEKIKFGSHGTYSLVLKKVSDGTILLSYSNNNIDLWRTETTFVRPKWGIYRSLHHPEQLRDEKVLFADFVLMKKK